MFKIKRRRAGLLAIATITGGGLAFRAMVSSTFASFSTESVTKFYADYDSMDEAKKAAAQLEQDIAAEGNVLLKNDGSLPLQGAQYVSLFGVSSDSLSNFQGYPLADALNDAGFKVNPTLRNYYSGIGTTYGSEDLNFTNRVESSYQMYNDVAFVVVSRAGGEGMYGDLNTVTTETINDEEENVNGWKHADAKTGKKHSLQFSDSEVNLLNYVKSIGFSKIVYIINSSVPMELYNIQNDNAVNGILWIGRPGQNATKSAARILAGDINPSGKTVDTWYTDFTADPTWQNFGTNAQVNSSNEYLMPDGTKTSKSPSFKASMEMPIIGMYSGLYGVDYEEDIFVGYRYYETVAHDMNEASSEAGTAWYNKAVTYPYGYGLSYTSFSYSDMSIVLDNGVSLSDASSSNLESWFSSDTGNTQDVKKATAYVTVTNTGKTAGKESVQLYISAPYGGKACIEKSFVTLVGFGKTKVLQPGAKEKIAIEFNIQDMASYDYNDANQNNFKGYELEAGNYTFRAMSSANGWMQKKSDYSELNFNLSNDVKMVLDDFSDQEVTNLFSSENGRYNSLRQYSETSGYQFNKDTTANMTLLSRKDISCESDFNSIRTSTSFPTAPTEKDLTLSQKMVDSIVYWNDYTAKDGETATEKSDYPWLNDVDETRMASWLQAADTSSRTNGKTKIQLCDMAGIDPYGTQEITDGYWGNYNTTNSKHVNGEEAWDIFMNQLTADEIITLCGKQQSGGLDSVGMGNQRGADSTWNYSNTYCFTDNCTLAATWNKELAKKEGILIGNLALFSGSNAWWGAGAQVHRSYFAGRAYEYMGEDPILAGYMVASETKGTESKGIACFTKHALLNDQEANRCGLLPISFTSEQSLRERYAKPLQMAIQEGGASGIMGAFSRVGTVPTCANYNLLTKLFKEQWGAKNIAITTDAYAGMQDATTFDSLIASGITNLTTAMTSTTRWNSSKNCFEIQDSNQAWQESKAQYYFMRTAAMNFLYVHANTAMNKNGYDWSSWIASSSTFSAKQGSPLSNISVGKNSPNGDTEYSISSGKLPNGVSLNKLTGDITGTPLESGDFAFTILTTIDGWITASKDFNLHVDSAITIAGNETVVAGSEYYAAVVLDMDVPTGATVTYAATGLPAGVSIDATNGDILGTPNEAGEYEVEVSISVTTKSGGGMFGGATTTVTTYASSFIMKVTEKKHTITFDSNGGSEVSSQIVTNGDRITAPTAPTKEGYTFTGWYLDKDCTQSYDFMNGVSSDMTLYAGYTKADAWKDDINNQSSDLKDDYNGKIDSLKNDIDSQIAGIKTDSGSQGNTALIIVVSIIGVVAVAGIILSVMTLLKSKKN